MNNNGVQITDWRSTNKYQYSKQLNYFSKLTIDTIQAKDDTIFISNYRNRTLIIKLFALNKSFRIIKKHQEQVDQIYFMNQSSQFLLYQKSSVYLWDYDNSYNWVRVKTICTSGWRGCISSLIISQNDDLIVHLMRNERIQFRRKEDNWNCYLQLECEKNDSILLNETSDKLVAFNFETISLYTYYPEEKINWVKTDQKTEGCQSACYLDKNSLICLSSKGAVFNIYQIDQTSRLIKIQSLQFQTKVIYSQFTSIHYFKQQKMILTCYGSQIIFIKQAFDHNYIIEQQLSLTGENSFPFFLMNLIQQGNFILTKRIGYEVRRLKLYKRVQLQV